MQNLAGIQIVMAKLYRVITQMPTVALAIALLVEPVRCIGILTNAPPFITGPRYLYPYARTGMPPHLMHR